MIDERHQGNVELFAVPFTTTITGKVLVLATSPANALKVAREMDMGDHITGDGNAVYFNEESLWLTSEGLDHSSTSFTSSLDQVQAVSKEDKEVHPEWHDLPADPDDEPDEEDEEDEEAEEDDVPSKP